MCAIVLADSKELRDFAQLSIKATRKRVFACSRACDGSSVTRDSSAASSGSAARSLNGCTTVTPEWDGKERRRGGSGEELRARIEKLQRDWQEEQARARGSSEREGGDPQMTRHQTNPDRACGPFGRAIIPRTMLVPRTAARNCH